MNQIARLAEKESFILTRIELFNWGGFMDCIRQQSIRKVPPLLVQPEAEKRRWSMP